MAIKLNAQITLLAAALAAFAGSAIARGSHKTPDRASDEQTREGLIFERQQIMNQLGRDSELLGKIVAGIEPSSKLAATTRSIAAGAKESLESFRQEIPGGRAKPDVWSPTSDFFPKMEAFVGNSEAMAKAGETGSVPAVTALMIDALPCKQCHMVYREPKQP